MPHCNQSRFGDFYKTIVILVCLKVKASILIRIIVTLFFLSSAFLGQSQEGASKALYRSDNGVVSFVSDAPLELISARSNELAGLLDPEKGTFAFQIATQTLTGFNSPLQQEHFYENYIETEKYPTATFTGKIIEKVDFNTPGEQEIRAKGILDIHGVKKERIVKVDLEIEKDRFTARSTFTVNLEDHNITIPKLVYQKIAEEVQVNIQVTLTKNLSAVEEE